MIRKQITSFIVALCLMQASLIHATNPVDYAKSFYNAAANQHNIVAASLLVATIAGIAALIYKKNKSVEHKKLITSSAPVERVIAKLETPTIEETILSKHDLQPASVEQKTLVTVEMMPLYGQSVGSYDLYIQ